MLEAMSEPRGVVVTGGAGGIGSAIIDRFQSAGWKCCSIDITPAATNEQTHSVQADLRTADACRQAVAEAARLLGRIDAVVNAAGVWHEGDTADTTEADFDRVIDVNLKGTYFVSAAALAHLELTRGCIVNISSDAGIQGNSGAAAYCASKGGVSVFTKALALELAPRGVRVNAVCPGVWTRRCSAVKPRVSETETHSSITTVFSLDTHRGAQRDSSHRKKWRSSCGISANQKPQQSQVPISRSTLACQLASSPATERKFADELPLETPTQRRHRCIRSS